MTEIRDLLNDIEVAPVFKLLVTSPVRSRHVAGEFLEQHRLVVPNVDHIDSRQEPTEREISMMRTRRMRPMPSRFATSMRNTTYSRRKSAKHDEDFGSDPDYDWLSDIEDEMDLEANEESDL